MSDFHSPGSQPPRDGLGPLPPKGPNGCLIAFLVVFGLFIALVVVGAIVGKNATKPGALPAAQTSPAPTATSPSGEAVPASNWNYSDNKDQMGSTSKSATVTSDNAVNFDFPYSGEQHGSLIVRKGKDGTDVMLVIERGQILCHSFSNDTIAVKFDDGPIQKFRCLGPADNSTETAFFSDSKRFVKALLKSKKVVLEPNIYQQGGTQFTFQTAGLKWD